MAKAPILYYSILSPPSRAVLLTAKAIGLEMELREMNILKDEHLTADFLKINPQHTIPTLDDDGVIIYDSHVICGYLIDKYAKDDLLYPKDLVKRAQIKSRLHFDTGYLFARLRFLYEPIVYSGSTDCSLDKIAYIQKTYDIMESFLKDHEYLCGDGLSIADFCCVATISTVDEIAPIDKSKYPKLNLWMEKLAQLPYYENCNGKGAEGWKKIFKEKLAENKSK